MTGTKFG